MEEPPLAGWTIFLDTDADGVLDAGEAQTTTDAQGHYAFSDLPPGSYTVAEVGQDGWWQTYPRVVAAEDQANTHTDSTQANPSIAMGVHRQYVVVWESLGQDGDGWGIFGQRYNPDGTKAGLEFQVNTYTTGDQRKGAGHISSGVLSGYGGGTDEIRRSRRNYASLDQSKRSSRASIEAVRRLVGADHSGG